jgi:predicted O-methyltransferase YrrM
MAVGCATTAASDPNYKPSRGQSGKDVIWIPTPPELVEKMLTMAKVTPQDRVFDLGSGDGIIAMTAAQKFKANAVGIEFNPDMAGYARRKVAEESAERGSKKRLRAHQENLVEEGREALGDVHGQPREHRLRQPRPKGLE